VEARVGDGSDRSESRTGSLVSVIVPTRDRSATLRVTLRSILAQPVDLEVIVVDDGTGDAAKRVCADLDDERVRRVPSGGCASAAAARNVGIESARGELVAFCDDDDLWAPDRLPVLMRAIGASPWACSGAVHVDIDLKIIGHQRVRPTDLARLEIENVIPGGGSGVVVRRAALREIGGFDVGLAHSEDWELWIRLAKLGAPAVVDHPLVAYRIWEGSKSRNVDGLHAAAISIQSRGMGARPGVVAGSDRFRVRQRLRNGDRFGAARGYVDLARRSRRFSYWGVAFMAGVAPGVLNAAMDRSAMKAVPKSWRSEVDEWLSVLRAGTS
jgi:glycosyltransferase involved in cell wall biosynthesis